MMSHDVDGLQKQKTTVAVSQQQDSVFRLTKTEDWKNVTSSFSNHHMPSFCARLKSWSAFPCLLKDNKEGEMESIAANALNAGSETGALVEVKFQKTPYQTQKYLEAEPKALGVTQIMLSLYIMSTIFCSLISDFDITVIISPICSSASIIAGSVAIAAQNLDLPTLKACLGMQVVACVVSVISFVNTLGDTNSYVFRICWEEEYINGTSQTDMCDRLLAIHHHMKGIESLVQVTQIALSATLAAFCCKVIQCCSPRKHIPVIMVNAPPGPQ